MSELPDDFMKPARRTVVRFCGGPHDGEIDTDQEPTDEVLLARFMAARFEETGKIPEGGGNLRSGSPVRHYYEFASCEDHPEHRVLTLAYTGPQEVRAKG
jgi:hypothetical protein